MANIKITVEGPLMDGHKITFKAPCNCDVVEKLDVRYIENDTQKSKLFTMKDAHGNDLTGLGNLFYKNAYVDVVLDPNSGSAYLQNAGTNKYLEQKTTPVDNFESDRSDLPASARTVKVLNESLVSLITPSDVKMEFGKVTTEGSTRVITLQNNYEEMLYFNISWFKNNTAFIPRGITFTAPNTVSFNMKGFSDSVVDNTVSAEHGYMFVGK